MFSKRLIIFSKSTIQGGDKVLTKKDIQEGKDIMAIMMGLNDEGKRIVISFAEGALKMQEVMQDKQTAKQSA